MSEFLDALRDPNTTVVRYALIVGLLASVSLGVLGSYVVVRRTTYIADAIAHCVLGGIGAELFLRQSMGLTATTQPVLGSTIAALAAGLGIGLVSLYAREREDTVISLVWVGGVAVGLLLLDVVSKPEKAMAFLIGDILYVSLQEIWLVAALDAVVVAVIVLFRNKLAAVAFDQEYSEVRGLNAKFYYLLLLCLTSLIVVFMVRIVGSLMVVALLALPAAIAGRFTRHLWQMMLLAVVLCAVFVIVGLAISYPYDLKTGPIIILVSVAAYLFAAPLAWAVGRRA